MLPESAPARLADGSPGDPVSLRLVLRAGLQRYARHLSADPLREKAMLELTQYALRPPSMHHLAREQYDRYHALAAQALDSAARSSGSVWSQPVDDVARLMVALTDGLTIAWLVDRDDRATGVLIDTIADTVAALGRPA